MSVCREELLSCCCFLSNSSAVSSLKRKPSFRGLWLPFSVEPEAEFLAGTREWSSSKQAEPSNILESTGSRLGKSVNIYPPKNVQMIKAMSSGIQENHQFFECHVIYAIWGKNNCLHTHTPCVDQSGILTRRCHNYHRKTQPNPILSSSRRQPLHSKCCIRSPPRPLPGSP